MKLSKRLEKIYDCIPSNTILADIGSDHAYIPCYCLMNNKCKKAYACELRDGPLEHAKKTIISNNLENDVFPIKSDGLENMPEDANTVVIAGMGYDTIIHILEAYPNKLSNISTFIIQSNKNVDLLRTWISNHNYTITNEEVVNDSFFYEIISFNLNYSEPLNERQILFGQHSNKTKEFNTMWSERLNVLNNILKGIDCNHPKYKEINQQIILIKEELKKETE